eukprot:NODE_6493_length_356_cov_80.540717_g5770_i0.p3 GENE.NODE_6493_length_356_cov_80.540717_g5770_i0~~NODE_6493_length_356_cov_80.540717_g5770_i0.p3  ORF type:complete len:59 (-),score=2.53 NODE_6493_length_356_cov_80.540717_g5770_i0:93-269(-)
MCVCAQKWKLLLDGPLPPALVQVGGYKSRVPYLHQKQTINRYTLVGQRVRTMRRDRTK